MSNVEQQGQVLTDKLYCKNSIVMDVGDGLCLRNALRSSQSAMYFELRKHGARIQIQQRRRSVFSGRKRNRDLWSQQR